MEAPSYGYSRTLKGMSYEEALQKVPAAFKAEGFGVQFELDIKKTMKEKLNAELRKYTIFGVCNPQIAFKAFTGEPFIGLLLPCNVTVFEDDNHEVVVSVIKPMEMLSIVHNPGMAPLGTEADARLQKALASV